MKTLLLAATALLGFTVPYAANAGLLAQYDAGSGFTTICSGGPSCGTSFVASNGLAFTLFGATSNSPGDALNAKVLQATVQLNNPTASAQSITLVVGDTGFTSPTAPPATSLINSIAGTVTTGGAGNVFNAIGCIDQADGQNVCPGTINTPLVVANITTPGSGNNSSTAAVNTLNSPYSMSERLFITLDPGANINFSASSDVTAASEPASLALMGVGLVGLGWIVSRRRNVVSSLPA